MQNKSFYITTPIYYVNDKPHIGHGYCTLVADIVAGAYALNGFQSYFLTGTDEHGAKIEQAAQRAGKQPAEFCNEVSSQFQDAWSRLGIAYSRFIRTTDDDHIQTVQSFLNTLKEKGALYEAEYKGWYCIGCENFINEADLVDGKCAYHNKKPEWIVEKNWFFRLSAYAPLVKSAIERGELVIQPERYHKEVLGLFEQEIPDFSVSRLGVSWGIPLPWDRSQTIYVWVDALINYLSATGWGNTTERAQLPAWPADVHVLGKDILKFHALFWPALLLAAELPTPKSIQVTGHFTIDGQKMSKSLGNVIDPLDLVTRYGAEATRYLIVTRFPFGNDGDIATNKLDEAYNADLANGIGNLVQRVTTLIEKYDVAEKIEPLIDENYIQEILDHICGFDVYGAMKLVIQRAGRLDEYLAQEQPWKLDKNIDQAKALQILQHASNEIGTIAYCLAPVMPSVSREILFRFSSNHITTGTALFMRV